MRLRAGVYLTSFRLAPCPFYTMLKVKMFEAIILKTDEPRHGHVVSQGVREALARQTRVNNECAHVEEDKLNVQKKTPIEQPLVVDQTSSKS